MKSVLISIQPYWVFLIIAKAMGWNTNEEKTIEVRKNHPKDKCWDKAAKIYCSKDKKSFAKIPKEYQPFMGKFLGKVIGEFVCDTFEHYTSNCTVFESVLLPSPNDLAEMCLTLEELNEYGTRGKLLYGWHISDLVIYDKPKELSEFYTRCYSGCGNCEHVSRGYSYGGGIDLVCTVSNKKPIKRPPQSWCYVEGGDSDA